jgi:hypothetical protein
MSRSTRPDARRLHAACLTAVLAACLAASARGTAQSADSPAATPVAFRSSAPLLTDTDIERFLTKAKILKTRGTGVGVTDSVRATLSDGRLTHDAHIQTIDEHRREFRGTHGVEFDFRDSWTYNIAAYKLDRLIGLHMVPVSVARSYRSNRAAFTWWVDHVLMDEGTRLKRNVTPPPDKAVYWTEQLHMMRLFDQLIYNTDRNMGNILIGEDWRLWAIDHTRAFRKQMTLRSPGQVVRCDREVFEKLKALDQPALARELGRYLDSGHLRAILARRDAIVERLESLGPTGLFDRREQPLPAQ